MSEYPRHNFYSGDAKRGTCNGCIAAFARSLWQSWWLSGSPRAGTVRRG